MALEVATESIRSVNKSEVLPERSEIGRREVATVSDWSVIPGGVSDHSATEVLSRKDLPCSASQSGNVFPLCQTPDVQFIKVN